MERSAQLDRERKAGRVRIPFHCIPMLVKICHFVIYHGDLIDLAKDAIATGLSLELATTLGSLALKHSLAPKSARIVAKVSDQRRNGSKTLTL